MQDVPTLVHHNPQTRIDLVTLTAASQPLCVDPREHRHHCKLKIHIPSPRHFRCPSLQTSVPSYRFLPLSAGHTYAGPAPLPEILHRGQGHAPGPEPSYAPQPHPYTFSAPLTQFSNRRATPPGRRHEKVATESQAPADKETAMLQRKYMRRRVSAHWLFPLGKWA